MAHRFQRVAHRGGAHLAPENTLAAFRNALTMPIDAVELDVQMTRDGHDIIFHDGTVDRVTDGSGRILDLDFAYVRSLNATAHFPGNWPQPERIPTLREVLDLVKGRTTVYIEIKAIKRDDGYGRYPRIVETVVDAVRVTKMVERVLVISFDWSVLPDVKTLEPSLQTGALVNHDNWSPQGENALVNLCSRVASLGCSWINMDRKFYTDEMPALIHAHGFKLGVWTPNTLEEIRRFAASGVDSITTDRPDLFAEL